MSFLYLFFLFGTGALVLGVMIDAMVSVSRRSAWELQSRAFRDTSNVAGQAPAGGTFRARRRARGAALPVNDEEWRLTA